MGVNSCVLSILSEIIMETVCHSLLPLAMDVCLGLNCALTVMHSILCAVVLVVRVVFGVVVAVVLMLIVLDVVAAVVVVVVVVVAAVVIIFCL